MSSQSTIQTKIPSTVPKPKWRTQRVGPVETAPHIEISVVVPLFNEANSLEELTQTLHDSLQSSIYEILFVDDGSTDTSWEVITQLTDEYPHIVKAIKHRRNFGKAEALASGFAQAKGKIVASLDADLQDDPKEIPNLIAKLNEGYDMVTGWKQNRCDPLSKTIPSRLFNFCTRIVSGLQLHDFNCGIKVYRAQVLSHLELYGELHRFIPILIHSDGYKVAEQAVVHHPRKHGSSKYGWKRLLKGGLDLLTVLLITRYLKRPAHFFGGIGIITGSVGTITLLHLSMMKLFFGQDIGPRPLFFFGILALLFGAQLICTGIVGELLLHHRTGGKGATESRISESLV
ncbi:glycosyltransferase family 2 protein [Puniceicoccaceae bacterium K14]|nr:glycosyltransferase family 2 protein [Puniceicoccaceae bacterium K14]